jgi:NADH dehydrogenase
VILMCALNAILFWGGYLPPIDWAPLYMVPGIIWLFVKILLFFFLFSWIKATVPRYRYDQLMRLGWKIFLPISLLWVFLVSGYLMLTRYGVDRPQVFDVIKVQYDCPIEHIGDGERIVAFSSIQLTSQFTTIKLPNDGDFDHQEKWTITGPKYLSGDATLHKDFSGPPDLGVGQLKWQTPAGKMMQATLLESSQLGTQIEFGDIGLGGFDRGNCNGKLIETGL